MAEFPALPLWTDAFLGDTSHLSTEELGAYILLLFAAWRRPNCDLPDDDRYLANVTRCDVRTWRKRYRPVLEPFHTVDNNRWTQKRLTKERNRARDLSEKMSEISHRRWNKNKDIADANASATHMPTQCTHTHTQKEERKRSSSFSRGNGAGAGAAVGGGEHVTLLDPRLRLERFMNKLAEQLGGDAGWTIIIAATDASDPCHAQALHMCRDTARAIGKGWPKQWPTDGKFFSRSVSHET